MIRKHHLLTHGYSGGKGKKPRPEYTCWSEMRQRCRNMNHSAYNCYGGRGIKVCKRWEKFENFLADMGERPGPEYSLDRMDNDKGYKPSNCRWATRKQQNCNRRSPKKQKPKTLLILSEGVRLRKEGKTDAEITAILGVSRKMIFDTIGSIRKWKKAGSNGL